MKTTVISYFCDVDTNNTYYSSHAFHFIKNMQKLNMPYYVEEITSRGSYRSNCLYKPSFILKCMEKINGPVIWLDIDSYVYKKLDMFENINSDVVFATNSINEKGNFIPKASPIYLSGNEKSFEFINKWIEKCEYYLKNEKKFFDHEIMLEVLEEIEIEIGLIGSNFCLFANSNYNKDDAVIVMGISDGDSKIRGLIDMGQNKEQIIGNSAKNTYYTNKGII